MTKIALNTVRWAFLLSFFGLSSAAEAQPAIFPRDFFIGQWERWNFGDPFFPDKILFEADPETRDRLLVTFTLNCMYPAPSCSATKRSEAAFWTESGGAMVYVSWFKDAAGSQYAVSFQSIPPQARLVPNAVKELNADFTITPSFNREAEFAGQNYPGLRYTQ
jgi:hypothetical protein